MWVKMLNNGIRVDLTEKMRFEPKIETNQRINHMNIRSRNSHYEGECLPGKFRTNKGTNMFKDGAGESLAMKCKGWGRECEDWLSLRWKWTGIAGFSFFNK